MSLFKEEEDEQRQLPWVVLVPFPALGHITPIVQLARALGSQGSFRPMIAVPSFIHRRICSAGSCEESDGAVSFESIPDGLLDDGGSVPDFSAIEHAMECHMPAHFDALLGRIGGGGSGGAVACVVVDLLASWAIRVARRRGVAVAGFWPAMLATYRIIRSIPEMLRRELISESGIPLHHAKIQEALCLKPELSTQDLPWLVGSIATQKSRFKFWLSILKRSRSLEWLLVNSFPGEDDNTNTIINNDGDDEDNNQLRIPDSSGPPQIFHVAPLIMSNLTHHRNPSLWEEDESCLDWLDTKSPSSVIYVSSGSWVGPVPEEEVRETALGLEATGRPFLWVLRDEWRKGLLPCGYLDRVRGRGRVVGWAPQKSVLSHTAVACHVTHCGWNSTLESIQSGKSLVCRPISGDQAVNCAYAVDVWKVGVRLSGAGGREIVRCVERVVGGQGEDVRAAVHDMRERVVGDEIRRRAGASLESFVDKVKKEFVGGRRTTQINCTL